MRISRYKINRRGSFNRSGRGRCILAGLLTVCLFVQQFLRMVDACANFLSEALHPDNCVGILRLADTHSLDRLRKSVQNYIVQNFPQVLTHEEFLELPAEILSEILGADELCVTEEEQVFETVMRWVRYREAERKGLLCQVLRHVRLPLLDPWYFVEWVEGDELVWKNPDVFPLLQEARMYHLSGNEVGTHSTDSVILTWFAQFFCFVLVAVDIGKGKISIYPADSGISKSLLSLCTTVVVQAL